MRPARRAAAVALALVMAWAAPAAAAEPPGQVAILTYHRVGPAFPRQLAALERAGYTPITLGRAWRAWRGEAGLPRRPVVLTFDDGYASQYRIAAPALRRRGRPGMLNLQVARLGAPGGLTRGQVRRLLREGWELGAHTIDHPDLRTLGPRRLAREVAGSRSALERAFGISVSFFCYPYGRFDAGVKAAVRAAGFLGATTTRRALASPEDDPLELPRVAVGARTSPRTLLRRLRDAARR